MVLVAISKRNKALVIGMYGNSLFENIDSNKLGILINAFKQVLINEGFGKQFTKVVFAKYTNDPQKSPILAQFSKTFK